MSKKIRMTPELITKAREVFTKAKKGSIISGEGLSRGELRVLEKAGYVRKMIVFGDRKFSGQSGTRSYVWQWVGDYDSLKTKKIETK